MERQFDRATGALAARRLPGDIGLIRFNNSIGEQATVAAFDAALEQLRGTRGLILDLRDVPSGGDSSVALGIMGRFVHTMRPYQRHRIPNYGQSDVERNWLELVAPRGPFTYDAPVVVLVDHWTGSMGEGMAIGMDALQRAAVVGTPMAQLAGAVTDFHLARTGIDVAFATEQLYHVNGTLRQDWRPPILVAEPAPTADDPVLARGVAQLQHLLSSPSSGQLKPWKPPALGRRSLNGRCLPSSSATASNSTISLPMRSLPRRSAAPSFPPTPRAPACSPRWPLSARGS